MAETSGKNTEGSEVTGGYPPKESRLRFSHLGESVVESLSVGVVGFDNELKVIEANSCAAKFIELGDYIDRSLANGTDLQIWGNWTEQLKEVISKNKSRDFDNVCYRTGDKERLFNIICTPLKDSETNDSIGGTVVIEDITERVSIQRQLANAERLAAVGKLASKVAHELNNPMDGILRYINLAMRIVEKEKLAKPQEYLKQCRTGLMRMVQIISELLEFSRGTYSDFEYINVENIIEEALKTMESQIHSANIRINRDYGSDMPPIRSGNLFQVFCNLIKNAIDAMVDGGELSIVTRLSKQKNLTIEFCDTGAGFAPKNMEAIFEPFFTTKERGKGTGLGLAICKDIIEKYYGKITAMNRPGGGSVFTVMLTLTGENSIQSK